MNLTKILFRTCLTKKRRRRIWEYSADSLSHFRVVNFMFLKLFTAGEAKIGEEKFMKLLLYLSCKYVKAGMLIKISSNFIDQYKKSVPIFIAS